MWRFTTWRLVSCLQIGGDLPVIWLYRCVLHHPTPPKHRHAVFLSFPCPFPPLPSLSLFNSLLWLMESEASPSPLTFRYLYFFSFTQILSITLFSFSFLARSLPPPPPPSPLPFLLAPLRRVLSSNWPLLPFFVIQIQSVCLKLWGCFAEHPDSCKSCLVCS